MFQCKKNKKTLLLRGVWWPRLGEDHHYAMHMKEDARHYFSLNEQDAAKNNTIMYPSHNRYWRKIKLLRNIDKQLIKRMIICNPYPSNLTESWNQDLKLPEETPDQILGFISSHLIVLWDEAVWVQRLQILGGAGRRAGQRGGEGQR